MTTVYTAFNSTKPDPASTDGGGTTLDHVRRNLLAVRDMVIMYGMVPGWNYSYSGGTAEQPADVLFTKSISGVNHKVKLTHTYNGDGTVQKVACYYSADNAATWDNLDDDAGNFVQTFTYDGSANLIASTWGSTP
jgi:hypothetical protein